jgi:hypothetical protein
MSVELAVGPFEMSGTTPGSQKDGENIVDNSSNREPPSKSAVTGYWAIEERTGEDGHKDIFFEF